MQSLSNAHGGTLEAEQANHVTAGGCYIILEHRREPEVFGDTGLDLAFAIGHVSCFLEEPREDHLAVVK
jgi:hypothetical protein